MVGFNHDIDARNQSAGGSTYTFASWSDGWRQRHTIVVPTTDQSYAATYTVTAPPAAPTFVQVNSATPQTNQTTVSVPYTAVQTVGELNVVAVGWNDNHLDHHLGDRQCGQRVPGGSAARRGLGLSQAIYYAKNVNAAAAGANTRHRPVLGRGAMA